MDTENIAPVATLGVRPGARRKGLSARGKPAAAKSNSGKPKEARKPAAKKPGGAPEVRPRRALGDITNHGAGGGGGGGGLGKPRKGAKEAAKAPVKEERVREVARAEERAVPRGPGGGVADVEDIPLAGMRYVAKYEEPDLVAELGLEIGGKGKEVLDQGMLDELPTILEREDFVGLEGIGDEWEDLEFENDDGWRGVDVDLGVLVTELPELYIDGDEM